MPYTHLQYHILKLILRLYKGRQHPALLYGQTTLRTFYGTETADAADSERPTCTTSRDSSAPYGMIAGTIERVIWQCFLLRRLSYAARWKATTR